MLRVSPSPSSVPRPLSPFWPGGGSGEPSPCTCRGQRRGVQRRQFGGREGCAQEANGVPLSVHFFFRTVLRFGGSALSPLWRAARPVRGMVFTSLAGWSQRGGLLKGGGEGRNTPGSGLVRAEPGVRPPTPEEVGLHMVHFETGTHPAPKKENHGARLQRWRAGGRGPGVNAASSAALLALLPGSQGGGCRPHARDPPPAAALAAAGLMAEGGAPVAFVEGKGPDHRPWFQWSGSSSVRSAEVSCETAEVWY